MELRRALLLFAIVLGVAAVVAAVANPGSRTSERMATTPPAVPRDLDRSRSAPATVRVDGRGAPALRMLEIGRATTVVVSVNEPGIVELEGLGLTDAAEERDPAIFDTLPTRKARYRVLFTPSGGVRARALGVLVTSRPTS